MRLLGSALWNLFGRQADAPASDEDPSVGALVRLLKSRRATNDDAEPGGGPSNQDDNSESRTR